LFSNPPFVSKWAGEKDYEIRGEFRLCLHCLLCTDCRRQLQLTAPLEDLKHQIFAEIAQNHPPSYFGDVQVTSHPQVICHSQVIIHSQVVSGFHSRSETIK